MMDDKDGGIDGPAVFNKVGSLLLIEDGSSEGMTVFAEYDGIKLSRLVDTAVGSTVGRAVGSSVGVS